jgi:cytochrome c oxidase assembly protein subunit 15
MSPRALHRFAVFTAVLTLLLLGAGGLVTSHGVGMAVPDWPNTFGYNMFFFPFSQWVGGVFYEHSHRLIASGVGLCTAILAIWLHGRKARPVLRWIGLGLLVLSAGSAFAFPARWADAIVLGLSGAAALGSSFVWPRCEPAGRWLRRLGLVALVAVVLQGVLGGLRVVLFKDQIGIFHATLAQLFFALTCAIALFTSRWWEKRFGSPWGETPVSLGHALGDRIPLPHALSHWERKESAGNSTRLSWFCFATTVLILGQLVLGATMRHQHAGLAIPDFPAAYGRLWPATDSQSVAHYNQQRIEVLDVNPITAIQIEMQMLHRVAAVAIFAGVVVSAWTARRQFGRATTVSRLTLGWVGLVLAQVLLGAATIWSNKAADIATAHVLVGALSLTVGTSLCIILQKQRALMRTALTSSVAVNDEPSGAFGARPSAALGVE